MNPFALPLSALFAAFLSFGITPSVTAPSAPMATRAVCQALAFPRPPASFQESGSQIAQRIGRMDRPQRQDALAAEIFAGHVPRFLRRLATVRYTATDAAGVAHEVEIAVTSDYLSVGTDADFLRISLDRPHAEAVAAAAGALLPTRFLVDRIHASAQVMVEPRPIPPSAAMVTIPVLVKHNQMLAAQHLASPDHALRAGHKKDVVMTRRMADQPNRVAIYGWHHVDGKPIQPLSLFHEQTYADYSHGIRLVDRRVKVDGRLMDLADLLVDPTLAPLVSDEGALPASIVKNQRFQADKHAVKDFAW